MKRTVLTALAAVLAAAGIEATAQETLNYRLEGTVGQADMTERFYLADLTTGAEIDSVEVVAGKITPKEGSVTAPTGCVLVNKQRSRGLQPIFLEAGTIVVDGNVMEYYPKTLGGTPLNDEAQHLFDALDQLEADFSAQENPDPNVFIERLANTIGGVIQAHASDPLGYFCMQQFVPSLQPAKALELLALMEPAWKDNSVYQQYKSVQELKQKTGEGAMFTDFEAEYDGTTTRLSDYVGHGKYVLVDFWASWCGPCKREIPNLIKVYDTYREKGLVVLGVATWDKPEDTLKAIEEMGIPYPQMLNAQKAGSDAYGINGIPEIILFAPDGKIVARGLRGDAIEKKIAELL